MPGIDTTCAVVTETDPLYKGDVTAQVAGPDPAFYLNLEPGRPWHTTFTGGQEGAYTAIVRARDRAGNVATGQEKGFTLDSMPRGLGLALAAQPPHAYANGNTLYYGQGSGVFTLTAVATDTLSGLFSLAFPEATAGGATYGLDGVTTATRAQPYAFDANDTISATLTITASDRAGNTTILPFHVVRDAISPTVNVQAPSAAGLSYYHGDQRIAMRQGDVVRLRTCTVTTWGRPP
jgi:hypothetical protein